MLGKAGTEQFTIITRHDGKLIREQKIHDPFLWSTTKIMISRWDLFKALFKRQFTATIEVHVRGTEGVMRAVMMLDPDALSLETEKILAERKISRDQGDLANTCQSFGMSPR